MKSDIIKRDTNDALEAMNDFVNKVGLDNVKTAFDSKRGVISVMGSKDGLHYTTTVTRSLGGVSKNTTEFLTNLGKEALEIQIKDLRKQGLTQQRIADILNVSQATVSKYLRK